MEAGATNKEKVASSKNGEASYAPLFNVIPTAYYDLIARICPGMAFWVALSFVSPVFGKLSDLGSLSAANLFILIVLSYLSGIVFTGFSVVWDGFSLQVFALNQRILRLLGLNGTDGLASQWQKIAEKMETVTKKSEESGRIMTNALAEVALCQNLLTGLAVLSVVGLMSSGRHFYIPTEFWLNYIMIGLSLLVSMLFRQAMFLGRVQALYVIYGNEGERIVVA